MWADVALHYRVFSESRRREHTPLRGGPGLLALVSHQRQGRLYSSSNLDPPEFGVVPHLLSSALARPGSRRVAELGTRCYAVELHVSPKANHGQLNEVTDGQILSDLPPGPNCGEDSQVRFAAPGLLGK